MREEIKLELLNLARELTPALLPRFFGDLEEIRRTAELHAAGAAQLQSSGDVLLTVEQAAEMLNVSKDTLYRNDFGFTRHIGGRRRFSRSAIESAIRNDDLNPLRTDGNVTHPKWLKTKRASR